MTTCMHARHIGMFALIVAMMTSLGATVPSDRPPPGERAALDTTARQRSPVLYSAIVDTERDGFAGFAERPAKVGAGVRHDLLVRTRGGQLGVAFPGSYADATSGLSYDHISGVGCCVLINREVVDHPGAPWSPDPKWSPVWIGLFSLETGVHRVITTRSPAVMPRCPKISVGAEFVAYFDVLSRSVMIAGETVPGHNLVPAAPRALDITPVEPCWFGWLGKDLLIEGTRDGVKANWLYSVEKKSWTRRDDLNVAGLVRAGERIR